MTKRKPVVLLLDADTLVYSACTSVEQEIEWEPGFWTLHSDEEEAWGHFEAELRHIVNMTKATDVVMALSDYENERFRNVWFPQYKSNRAGGRKPMSFMAVRRRIEEAYETWIRPGLEGDDILGILSTNDAYRPGEKKIIVSLDKDMRTIPGLLVDYNRATKSDAKNAWKPEVITPAMAQHFFFTQVLTGDSVDGYKGCPGVGAVGAAKILTEDVSDPWAAILVAYEKAGLSEGDAIINARMARILHSVDYNFEKKEPIPWQPSEG